MKSWSTPPDRDTRAAKRLERAACCRCACSRTISMPLPELQVQSLRAPWVAAPPRWAPLRLSSFPFFCPSFFCPPITAQTVGCGILLRPPAPLLRWKNPTVAITRAPPRAILRRMNRAKQAHAPGSEPPPDPSPRPHPCGRGLAHPGRVEPARFQTEWSRIKPNEAQRNRKIFRPSGCRSSANLTPRTTTEVSSPPILAGSSFCRSFPAQGWRRPQTAEERQNHGRANTPLCRDFPEP